MIKQITKRTKVWFLISKIKSTRYKNTFLFYRIDGTEITDEDEESEIEELKQFMKQKVNPWNIKNTLQQINYSECSSGKDWDLKIVSWNINGLRAWLEVNFDLNI
jgi:hypothetical protein